MDISQYPQVEWVVRLVQAYGYLVLVPVASLEGPGVMMASGFLIRMGVLSFWPAYIALAIGDLLGDCWWYRVGHTLGATKVAAKCGVAVPTLERMGRAFLRHQNAVLIGSKLTMGFGFSLITLISVRAYRISFRRFFLINALCGLIWTLVPLGAGYYAGRLYEQVGNTASRVILVITLCCVVVCLSYFALSYFGKKLRDKVAPE